MQLLESSYLTKEEELCSQLVWFVADQTQLAKVFRRDVEELKRMQHEHMSKLEIHSNPLAFDELVQQQIQKFYRYRHSDDDEDEDEEENSQDEQRLTVELDRLHDDHATWLKKKKKDSKSIAPLLERLRK